MRRILVSAALVCVGVLAGCGGGSPTAPSTPTFPAVAGNYAGTININFPTLGTALSCPATTTVTQSGASVTIGALTPTGVCAGAGASPSLGTFTMSTTGSLSSITVNNVPISSCNGTYNAAISGGFSGSTFQFSFVYTAASGDCLTQPGNFSLSGTLTKQ